MRKLNHLVAALILAGAAFFGFATSGTVRAADHGDAPNLDNDQGADIADLFTFLDPSDNTRVIIIGTVHGFIVPGEAGNFAAFDPTVKFTFNLYQTSSLKTSEPIVVSFSARTGPTDPQTATIVLPGKGNPKDRTFTAPTTPASLAATANPQTITTDPTSQVKFFAGEVSDPFFFDIPGFDRFVASVLAKTPDPTTLTRGRNTFAGYNVLGIALSLPIDLARGAATNTSIGVDFTTSRQTVTLNAKTGAYHGAGAYHQIDRMGNPAINVALIPFAKKNLYNAGTPLEDSKGAFANDIVATLTALGTDQSHIGILAGVAVTNGDLLHLDLTQANTGNNGGSNTEARYPNGRRLADDTIDIILTLIANATPAPNNGVATGMTGLLGDNVDAASSPPQNQFPFLALPNQPQSMGATVGADGTQN